MTDIKQIMQMGQQLQARMAEIQESLEATRVEATSGGGMVTATVDGKGAVQGIKIDPICVDARDVEMLEDLIVAAVSQAQSKAQDAHQAEMKKATGGLPMQIPGLF